MKRTLSIVAVLIAALGLGLTGAAGGDTAPVRPAGTLPWDRLAEFQAAAKRSAGVEPDAVAGEAANVSYAEEAADAAAADRPAAQPLAPALPKPKPQPEEPAAQAPLRDPTEPGDEMRDMVAPFRMGQPGRPRGVAGMALPGVALKGRIIGPAAPPAAIVELQGALYVLHEESELTVDSPEAALGGLTLRVTQITSSEVRIEVMPLRQVMVLR